MKGSVYINEGGSFPQRILSPLSTECWIALIDNGCPSESIESHGAFESTTNHPLIVCTSDTAWDSVWEVTRDLMADFVILVE